jgi:hypothetical protein
VITLLMSAIREFFLLGCGVMGIQKVFVNVVQRK